MMRPLLSAPRAYSFPRREGKTKPYFCPLNTEFWQKFKDCEQDCEIRPDEHHGWNDRNIYVGRKIALCRGYTYTNCVERTITRTVQTNNLKAANIPQWHIDAVEKIYGPRDMWLVAFVG